MRCTHSVFSEEEVRVCVCVKGGVWGRGRRGCTMDEVGGGCEGR